MMSRIFLALERAERISRTVELAEGTECDQEPSPFEHTDWKRIVRVGIGVPAPESPPLPDPLVSRCPYPDMLRSDPRCEAPGTTPNDLPASGRIVARGDMEG